MLHLDEGINAGDAAYKAFYGHTANGPPGLDP